MNLKIRMLGLAALVFCAAAASAAMPDVSNVTVSAADGLAVTVSYDLEKDAIVTVDLFVNGVALGEDKYGGMVGDTFKPVKAGTGHVVKWLPNKQGCPVGTTLPNVTAKVTAWDFDAPPPVLAVLLKEPSCVRFYPTVDRLPGGGLSNTLYMTSWMVFRKIPAAGVVWCMGTPLGEISESKPNLIANEYPHQVTLTADYYMAVYECTRAQWYNVQKEKHSDVWTEGDGDSECIPISKTSWIDLRGRKNWPTDKSVGDGSFMGNLRKLTRNVFAFELPTEAQWEYACRAGSGSPLPNGKRDRGELCCWFPGNSGDDMGETNARRHKPGYWPHNGWGLYDMIGNVREVCIDTWSSSLTQTAVNPVGPVSESFSADSLILERGGSYESQWDWDADGAWMQRSAHRTAIQRQSQAGDIGFRVVAPAVYVPPAE